MFLDKHNWIMANVRLNAWFFTVKFIPGCSFCQTQYLRTMLASWHGSTITYFCSQFISPLPHTGENLQYTLVIFDFRGINYNALLMQWWQSVDTLDCCTCHTCSLPASKPIFLHILMRIACALCCWTEPM